MAQPSEDRQVADDRPFIIPMPFADLSPTFTADRPFFGAFNGDAQFANFVDFTLQYPYIENI
jgi:hypothetical protein